ncbi:MAG TPA: sugar ABC transporter ATP-binding protein [Candidatus Acetothermia bacterium]|nr:sugar ABC transporter ATP-binding protein [Candidatus Acetothermia bacterium]
MPDPLVRTVRLAKEFSGVRVLNDINIEIERGEVFGIIGENGAGKSTLIKLLNGTHVPTEGEIFFNGKRVRLNTAVAKSLGISTIPQEFNLVNDLNVYENIFLGREYRRKGGLLDHRRMKERARELLRSLQADVSPTMKVDTCSVAEKQMVEIAKAVAYNSKLLIMDEPTTVLTPIEIDILFDLIHRLREDGVTIIYISHKLKEVRQVCDRVMVLRDGEFIGIDKASDIDEHEMANKMVGRELEQIFPPKPTPTDDVVMRVENLSVPGLLHDISFDLHKGEILGFAGLGGSGRTELAETIIGIRKKSAGTLFINGKKRNIKSPSDAIANHIAYLPEDRQGTGVLVNFSVTNNVTLGSLKKYAHIIINHRKEVDQTRKYVKEFDIRTPSLKTKLRFLSGGNQQKVSLAKSLDSQPDIFIFDEPTRGIDINAKMHIFSFVHDLVESGISCIFISSELEEVIGVCNRVIVMREGRVAGNLTGNHINEEEIMQRATGVKQGVAI